MKNTSTPNNQESPESIFLLNPETRNHLWEWMIREIENYLNQVSRLNVAPILEVDKIRSFLKPFDFQQPQDPLFVIESLSQKLWEYQVHTPHPRYFGLFNPAPTTMSILADTLVAALNPQLASWSHSPFAVESEQHLIRYLGQRFGYPAEKIDGTFTSGGAEANHTALLTALVHHFPQFAQEGVRGCALKPVLYISDQSHHSWVKAARFCGLGTFSIRKILRDSSSMLDLQGLKMQISQDRKNGNEPFLLVATAGTTNAGEIEPLQELAQLAEASNMWFHVDAAWGGAACFLPSFRPFFQGIERADSITVDAHKWLSVPMAAGIYLTQHPKILSQTCTIQTDYMPQEAKELDVVDPYSHSLSWSRRFSGFKVFLSLATAGETGYQKVLQHQVDMGNLLRQELQTAHWKIANQTPLPVVCFQDQTNPSGNTPEFIQAMVQETIASGKVWISSTRLSSEIPVLRACITNYRTQAEEIHFLIQTLNEARKKIRK